MKPMEYQALATSTEIDDYSDSNARLNPRIIHGLLGLSTEAGELQDAFKKTYYYGKPLDKENVAEEIGDVMWYIAILCNEMRFDLGEIMEANIAKLKKRYPEKFSETAAVKRADKHDD